MPLKRKMRNHKPVVELTDAEFSQLFYWLNLEFACANELGLIHTGEPWKEGALVKLLRAEIEIMTAEADRRVEKAILERRI
jgi:hypothetical protein